jgi:hypothetical protein
MKRQEGYLKGVRDTDIYYQYWMPEDEPKAILLVIHGLSEHRSTTLFHQAMLYMGSITLDMENRLVRECMWNNSRITQKQSRYILT